MEKEDVSKSIKKLSSTTENIVSDLMLVFTKIDDLNQRIINLSYKLKEVRKECKEGKSSKL